MSRNPPADRIPPITRRRVLEVASLGVVGAALTGCGSGSSDPTGALPAALDAADAELDGFADRFADFEPAAEPNGDLAKVVWPAWLDEFDPEVRSLYAFQVENGDLMRYMPCFCGCQWEDGHRNNRDCYVEAVNPDGSVVFDSMAPT